MPRLLSIITLLIALFSIASGQDATSIIAGTDTTGQRILVKWFNERIVFSQGVHLYRREAGKDWIKLTDRPLRKGEIPVPAAAIEKDSSLNAFVEAARTERLEGFIAAMLMVKVVLNNDFARHMGLCYVDEHVVSGISYQYRLTRIQAGRETTVAETAPVVAGTYTPTAPPAELSVKAGDSDARFRWKPEPERFFGVNVYRSSNQNPQPVKANKDIVLISKQEKVKGKEEYPDVFYIDTLLSNHQQYTYYLKGVDYLGFESPPSEAVIVAPRDQTPPEPPRQMKLVADGMNVRLTWENPDPSPDMAGYHVYRSKRMNSGYKHVNTTLLNTDIFSYVDIVTDPGEYFYYVASVDSAGNEGHSFKDMADIKDVYPPAAPRGLVAKADSGQISLRWIANREKDLLGYQIYRTVDKDNPSFYVLVNATPLNDTVFTDLLPAAASNKFHYKVAAIDSSFNRSAYSDPTFGAMPDLVPPARPFIRKITQQEKSLLVEWVSNVEPDLKAYHIYRMNTNDSTVMHLNIRPIDRQVNRFTDYRVEADEPYRYYITATDSANNISAPSEYFYATFVTDATPEEKSPIETFKASYKPGQKQIALRWKLNKEQACKGVTIFRCEDAVFVPVTGLIKGTEYHDNEIAAGKYKYRLHVFLNSGEVFRSEEIEIDVKPKK